MNILNYVAAADTEDGGDLFSALGIDFQTLIFQLIAFLLLVAVLAKWVFPILVKTVDKRQADIEAGAKLAEQAKQAAAETETNVEAMLKQARQEASEIVAQAKKEASSVVEQAESKAIARAESVMANAEDEIKKNIAAAKKTLHNEAIDLVAMATEKVLGATLNDKVDESLIASSIKESV